MCYDLAVRQGIEGLFGIDAVFTQAILEGINTTRAQRTAAIVLTAIVKRIDFIVIDCSSQALNALRYS